MRVIEIENISKFLETIDQVKLLNECQETAKSVVEKHGKLNQIDTSAIYANSFSSTYTISVISAYHDWLIRQLSVGKSVFEEPPLEN